MLSTLSALTSELRGKAEIQMDLKLISGYISERLVPFFSQQLQWTLFKFPDLFLLLDPKF